jgi:ArsR family transcriptional regulator
VSRIVSDPPFVGWMNTLGDTTRARILRLVERQELNVGELTTVLDLPQSTTSRHLKQLSDDGWLGAQRDGTSRLYRFNEQLAAPQRALWDLLRQNLDDSPSVEHDDTNLAQVIAARRSRTEAFFATAAERWDELRDEFFGPQLELGLVSALLERSAVVADLGCGTGRLSAALAPFVAQVFCIDNSEAMLTKAGKLLAPFTNVELRRGALEQLPLPSQSADLAVMCMVLHYLPEPWRALSEAARILKPDGKLVVADIRTHELEDFRSRMGHVWSGFTEDQLKAWALQSGLTPIHYHGLAQPSGTPPPIGRPEVFIQTSHKTDSP